MVWCGVVWCGGGLCGVVWVGGWGGCCGVCVCVRGGGAVWCGVAYYGVMHDSLMTTAIMAKTDCRL